MNDAESMAMRALAEKIVELVVEESWGLSAAVTISALREALSCEISAQICAPQSFSDDQRAEILDSVCADIASAVAAVLEKHDPGDVIGSRLRPGSN